MYKIWKWFKDLHWLTILAIISSIILIAMLIIINTPGLFDRLLN